MKTNVVECKDCAYGREANVPNAVFCMLNHETFPIPVYGCTNGRPGRIVPQTNADRIRAMSDEELAKYINELSNGDCPTVGDCPEGLRENETCTPWQCWLYWLKAPVEVQDGT